MKTKIIVIICSVFFLTSCSLDGMTTHDYKGFHIDISNDSGVEQRNAKLTIGGIKDGQFIGTESFSFPVIRIRQSSSDIQLIAYDDTRWQPNLDLIRAISDTAYFTVQLENQEPVLLYDSWEKYTGELVSLAIPAGIIINKDNGNLGIGIYKNSITAHLSADRDTP